MLILHICPSPHLSIQLLGSCGHSGSGVAHAGTRHEGNPPGPDRVVRVLGGVRGGGTPSWEVGRQTPRKSFSCFSFMRQTCQQASTAHRTRWNTLKNTQSSLYRLYRPVLSHRFSQRDNNQSSGICFFLQSALPSRFRVHGTMSSR